MRIFQQLQRFSKASTSACCRAIQPSHCSSYLRGMVDEFAALDISIEVAEKEKTMQTAIASTFLISATTIVLLVISSNRMQKSKLEVDTDPASEETEE